ncbi:MAG: V-type ATP synthase subunit F [Clostridia bacterium]|nr:V-type ATP synthase subunit F [Clostridia bacterium]
MKFFLISDNTDTCTGMRLAGIEGVVVHTAKEVEAHLQAAKDDPEIGVVLITSGLTALCPEQIYDLKLNCRRPLIVEIPNRHGDGRAEDSIARYVREAIGVKI